MEKLNDENTAVRTWQPFIRQAYISSSVCTMFFVNGLALGTSTVAIPQLKKEANSTTAVSDEMASWISSVTGFIGIIWTVVLSTLVTYYGYKKISFLVTINTIVCFIILYRCKTADELLIYEMLLGMTSSSCLTVFILIITEYSAPKYRGIFLTIKSATLLWGIWVANAIGAFSNFRNVGLLGISCTIYIIISILIMPESPYWLARKEKYEECVKSHHWLKGEGEQDMEKELEVLINDQKDRKKSRIRKKTLRDKFRVTLHNITKPEMYKPFLISTLLIFTYYGSGKFVYTIYAIEIIKKITKSESAAVTGMLVLDGVTIVGMYFGSGLSKILKRRTLTLTASLVGTLFLYSLSLYLYLVQYSLLIQNTIITLTLLTGFSLAVSCGPMIMLYAIHAEVTPIISRNFYTAVVGCFSDLSLGLTLKLTPYLFRLLGHEGTFLFFALVSTIMLILIYIYLPETKNKTLHEIAEYFKEKKSVDSVKLVELELLAGDKTNR